MRPVALLLAATLLAGCAQRQATVTGQPPDTPAETPSEATELSPELGDTTCETVNAGNPANFPDFVEVEVASADGVDRITFRFEPENGAPRKPLWHFISYVDQLATEGEGRPVSVEGEAFLLVSFQALGVDLSSEQPVEIYTGPERFTPATAP